MADTSSTIGHTDPRRFSTRLACMPFLTVLCLSVPALGVLAAEEEPGAPDDLGQNKVRIEDEYAKKVEKYNDLLKQKRFNEAIVLAKQAQLLQPENPMSELMVLKAKYAAQEDFNASRRLIDFEVAASNQEPAQMRASIAPGVLDHFIFGEGRATIRMRLDSRLAHRIASVDQNCRLANAQKERLELAGRGDIKRLFDRVDALQPEFHEDQVVDDRELQSWALTLSVHAADIRRTHRAGIFEDGSLFAKTLKTTLTANQAAAYAAAPPTPPEGSLVRWVDAADKKVWIGLGEADGVQPRTIYRVHKKPQAQRRPGEPQADRANAWIKGTIEVTRVLEENLSEARIVEEDVGNPIAKGDPIAPEQARAR
jgi:hypothetical protein